MVCCLVQASHRASQLFVSKNSKSKKKTPKRSKNWDLSMRCMSRVRKHQATWQPGVLRLGSDPIAWWSGHVNICRVYHGMSIPCARQIARTLSMTNQNKSSGLGFPNLWHARTTLSFCCENCHQLCLGLLCRVIHRSTSKDMSPIIASLHMFLSLAARGSLAQPRTNHCHTPRKKFVRRPWKSSFLVFFLSQPGVLPSPLVLKETLWRTWIENRLTE